MYGKTHIAKKNYESCKSGQFNRKCIALCIIEINHSLLVLMNMHRIPNESFSKESRSSQKRLNETKEGKKINIVCEFLSFSSCFSHFCNGIAFGMGSYAKQLEHEQCKWALACASAYTKIIIHKYGWFILIRMQEKTLEKYLKFTITTFTFFIYFSVETLIYPIFRHFTTTSSSSPA